MLPLHVAPGLVLCFATVTACRWRAVGAGEGRPNHCRALALPHAVFTIALSKKILLYGRLGVRVFFSQPLPGPPATAPAPRDDGYRNLPSRVWT